jgi:uncharacterized membrane protein
MIDWIRWFIIMTGILLCGYAIYLDSTGRDRFSVLKERVNVIERKIESCVRK